MFTLLLFFSKDRSQQWIGIASSLIVDGLILMMIFSHYRMV